MKSMSIRMWVALAGVVSLAVSSWGEDAAKPSDPAAAQAQTLFKAGTQAAKAKDWSTTKAKWDEALRLDPKNWEILNHYAWFLVDTVPPEMRDADKALALALKASSLTGDKNKDVLDTVAEIWFYKKDFAKAVEYGRKALEPGLQGHTKTEYFEKQMVRFEKALAESKAAAAVKQ